MTLVNKEANFKIILKISNWENIKLILIITSSEAEKKEKGNILVKLK